MVDNGDDTFTAVWGRVKGQINPDVNELKRVGQSKSFPMREWDKKAKQKARPRTNGEMYKDMTHLFSDTKTSGATASGAPKQPAKISNDVQVTNFFNNLQRFANKSVQENYSISKDKVTKIMVDEAQQIVDSLSKEIKIGASVERINNDLVDLFHVIPRRMGNVKDYLFKDIIDNKKYNSLDYKEKSKFISLEDAGNRIKNEQDTLDVMANQVEMILKQIESDEKAGRTDKVEKQLSLLETLGLKIVKATSTECEEIKKFMKDGSGSERKFKTIYRVENIKNQKAFDRNLKEASNKDVWKMFHGSRNQNWLNIVSTGLLIRPSGAIHTGSMFGDGIYGARQARKAINYTSFRGSYWASGNADKAYLGIFVFHVGNQKKIQRHDSSCYSLNYQKIKKDGFDSVYAKGGIDLINDEFIVYKPQQCTSKFLVELS